MKLITKYNRVNIIATIAVLLSASICYFFIVRFVLIHQLDNTLKVEEAEILSFIKRNNRLPEATNYRDQHTRFEQAGDSVKRKFNNISLYEKRHHESNVYRQLAFGVSVNGTLYKASVLKSEEEMEDLVALIVLITVGIIIFLLFILFITNRLLLRKIWKPFYNTLQSIKRFNLSNKKYPATDTTDIDEFRDLDAAVRTMTVQIIKDYDTLKNFADNASHEMQTPLAILNSKLDLLIQEPGLTESHTKQLQSMYDAITRLTKLNQSLLLLAKIENNQFENAEELPIDTLINEKLLQLEDLITTRHLQVFKDLRPVTIKMNGYLADILLNNLLGNAIRHNQDNGEMNIVLSEERLLVSNTGLSLSFDTAQVFDRFKKGDYSEGTGLGLSIVKQICDNYQFGISYAFKNNLHIFEIQFHRN
ncbi:MAG TPA: HAMP domain-containing sensor histidine kinase [Puia sp.]|nr:HAMP domain-containing sensor histidine kinase [Puia sp.]